MITVIDLTMMSLYWSGTYATDKARRREPAGFEIVFDEC